MLSIDPAVFRTNAIADETIALNALIVETLSAGPDQWSFSPPEMRARRARGKGPFPLPPRSGRAETIAIDGPGGRLNLRLVAPPDPRGVYLHIHGGGWTVGAVDEQDNRLCQIADRCGFAAVSVDYRLAPENPHPAANDDCEAAALWLVANAADRFGTDYLTIGGESAGAHLSVTTLLRLRDRHGIAPFAKANLVAGCYDLALTPSARRFGGERLVLRTVDIQKFAACYLGESADLSDPDISPIHADLSGLPSAHFSIGTRDALLDDTLFMAQRWLAAGNITELAVYPGGAHVFQNYDFPLARASLSRIDRFLAKT